MTAIRKKLLAAAACCLLLPAAASAQRAERLAQVKSIYVDSLGTDSATAALRNKIISHLRHSHEFQVADDPTHADARLKGTARIWTTGQVSLSPHSRSSQPVVEGYLSAEVVGKDGQTLWSYLVTPGKFPWGGVPEDLAKQLVTRLVAATHENAAPDNAGAGTAASEKAMLKGAGATFPAPLYRKWFELFEEPHAGVHIAYDAVGSAEGIRLLKEGAVDFGASEMPLTEESSPAGQRFRQVPVVLGAVVPIYNVKGLRQRLNFTGEILAGVYRGRIKKWNDPLIKEANPGVGLPDAEIVTVHRSDGSGTSFVFTDYLSKVSPEWKSAIGSGATVAWPVGIGAERNEGVAGAVQRTPNSMGYVEFIYALQHELSFGSVRNAAGQYVKADVASVMAAAHNSEGPELNLRVSLTNPPGKAAYPIASYTWLLLPEQTRDKEKKSVLVELVEWMLTSGQKSCAALGYAPLPPEIARRALQTVDAVR